MATQQQQQTQPQPQLQQQHHQQQQAVQSSDNSSSSGGGKVWFITGVSRGFGRVWTEDVLARGDRVAATVRDEKALDELRARYDERRLLVLPLDVTEREKVFAAVQRTHAHFGRLDVVLSNAGYGLAGAIEEVQEREVRANFDTNVLGTLSVLQAALPIVRAQGFGHLLPVTSVVGLVSFTAHGIYSATKHAVEAIGEALAQEVAQFGVRVTLVEPGPYKTQFFSEHSMRSTPHALPAYDAVAEAARTSLDGKYGDARATSAALFHLVDLPPSESAPLRLLLGEFAPSVVRQQYAARLDSIARWETLSNAAQGLSS